MDKCWSLHFLLLTWLVPFYLFQVLIILGLEMIWIWLSRQGLASYLFVMMSYHRQLMILLCIPTIINLSLQVSTMSNILAHNTTIDDYNTKVSLVMDQFDKLHDGLRVLWVTSNDLFHAMTIAYLTQPSGGTDAEKFSRKMGLLFGLVSVLGASVAGVAGTWLPVVIVRFVFFAIALVVWVMSFINRKKTGRVAAIRLQVPWSIFKLFSFMSWYLESSFNRHVSISCDYLGIVMLGGLFEPLVQCCIFLIDSAYWKRLVRRYGFDHHGTQSMVRPLIKQMFPSGMVHDWYHYKIESKLGEGAQACVYQVCYKQNTVKQAMKQYEAETLGPDVIANFLHESLLLYQIEPHPNVLKLEGVCICPPRLCIVTELCSVSLFAFLRSREQQKIPLSRKDILSIALDVSYGMRHLHRQVPSVIHRDLKSLNVLLTIARDSSIIAKVADMGNSRLLRPPKSSVANTYSTAHTTIQPRNIDETSADTRSFSPAIHTLQGNLLRAHKHSRRFGSTSISKAFGGGASRSRSLSSVMTGRLGTVPWCAPEVLRNEHYNNKCDVFSMGVLLWELGTGLAPGHFGRIFGYQCMNGFRLPLDKAPAYLVPLMTWCWDEEPISRPSFDQVVEALMQLQQEPCD